MDSSSDNADSKNCFKKPSFVHETDCFSTTQHFKNAVQTTPVNLVKQRHEISVNSSDPLLDLHKSSPPTFSPPPPLPRDSLAYSLLLMRRRRRGRSRHYGNGCILATGDRFQTGINTSSTTTAESADCPNVGDGTMDKTILQHQYTNRHHHVKMKALTRVGNRAGQYTCINCSTNFNNRDALAMHMLDSVRSDGCCSTNSRSMTVSMSQDRNGTTTTEESSDTPRVVKSNNSVSIPPGSTTCPVFSFSLMCTICGVHCPSQDQLVKHIFCHVLQKTDNMEVPSSVDNIEANSPFGKFKQSSHSPQYEQLNVPNSTLKNNAEISLAINSDNASSATKLESLNDEHFTENGTLKEETRMPRDRSDNKESCTLSSNQHELSSNDRKGLDPYVPNQEEETMFCSTVTFPYKCRHCRIAFEHKTIYCLHMGLHNVNNPWQCNMCGKTCSGLHEFSSHVLHF